MKEVADDIDMMTSSNENILHITGHLCGEFTGHRLIPRTKASDAELFLMFSLICVWINSWVNNGEDGDLGRHRPHYDVIIMEIATNGKNQPLHFRYDCGTTFVT